MLKENKKLNQEMRDSKREEIKNDIDFNFFDNNGNLLTIIPNINGIQTIFFDIIEKKKKNVPNKMQAGRGIRHKKLKKVKENK